MKYDIQEITNSARLCNRLIIDKNDIIEIVWNDESINRTHSHLYLGRTSDFKDSYLLKIQSDKHYMPVRNIRSITIKDS